MGGADRRPSSRWLDGQRGCASHRSRERMLEIMKDSRVGAMGVMACICAPSEGFLDHVCMGFVSRGMETRGMVAGARSGLEPLVYGPCDVSLADGTGSEGLAALFHGLTAGRRSLAGVMVALLTLVTVGFLWITAGETNLWTIAVGGILVIPFIAWAGSLTAERMSRRLGGLTGIHMERSMN